MGYISRNNFILQAGVPKRDFAFWEKHTGTVAPIARKYNYSDLAAAGKVTIRQPRNALYQITKFFFEYCFS